MTKQPSLKLLKGNKDKNSEKFIEVLRLLVILWFALSMIHMVFNMVLASVDYKMKQQELQYRYSTGENNYV